MRVWPCIFALVVAFFLAVPYMVNGQDSVQVITIKRSPEKKKFFKSLALQFDAVPHYSNEMGLGVALGLNFTEKLSVIGNFTTKGYMLVGLDGAARSKSKKWEFNYKGFYNYAPSYFWGLGYDLANDNSNKTGFNQKKVSIHSDALYSFTPHFKLGPSLGFEWIKWDDFIYDNRSSGALELGLSAQLDTRDSKVSPERGVYARARQRYYTNQFGTTSLQLCTYAPLWDGGVLAMDLYSIFAYGNVPLTMLPTIGGTDRMRGYYYGRYRNNNIVAAQLEIRQHIWKMISGAVWGAGANLWGKYGKFNLGNTLPNYGAGVRFAVTDNLKLRLDYGFGRKGQSAFIFSINEAF